MNLKSIAAALLLFGASVAYGQNGVTLTIEDAEWVPGSVTAGVESAMGMTILAINSQRESESVSIMIDFAALEGKDSAAFTFTENFLVPPMGASISFRPGGTDRSFWSTSEGTITITEFDEETGTASGSFEGKMILMLDQTGGFVTATDKPVKTFSGSFEGVKWRVVE